jgi:ABC-type uncharacterized transport system auxiliary subunit
MNALRIGCLWILAGVLAGCGLTAPQPPDRFHVLEVPGLTETVQPPTSGTPHHASTLLVAPTSGASFYDSQDIVFSRAEGTRGYYRYSHWTEAPSQRVSALLLARLSAAGGFRAVADGTSGVRGRWLLRTHVVELLHEAGTSPGVARLTISAELTDPGQRSIVARRTFTGSAPSATHDADGATRAMGVALGMVLEQIVAWADSAAVD